MLHEWITAALLRIKALLRRRQLDRDLNDELEFHLAMREKKLAEQGVTPEEAHYTARREFGNPMRAKETNREMWTFAFLETLLQDLRYGLRQLRRNPGFTAVAVITLALGIGANTAIFSVIDGVFLRPLPYPQANRLVYPLWVWNGESEDSVGSADYLFWKEHSRVFESAGAYEPVSGSNLVVGQQAHYVHVTRVSPGLFGTLGVNPALGRDFTQEEGQPNGPHAVILSYGLWRRLFPAGSHTIGHTVRMDGQSYVVVGVMPRSFQFVAAADVYAPLALTFHANNHDQNYGMVARLQPGVTLEQAQADTNRVFRLFEAMYPEAVWKGWRGLRLISYRQELTGDVRTPLFVLFGAVLLVLLIAIANVTSLFLGRAASRQTEIALRTAIGASRWRLLRQLVTEGVLLGALGGGLGLAVAAWSLKWLLAFIPHSVSIDLNTSLLPLGGHIKLSAGVLEFTFLVSALAGLAAGLFPYLQIRAVNLYEELKQGTRNTASSLRDPRIRNGLVIAEVALSVVLLAGAGLLTQSFLRLRTVNPGFDPQGVWALEISLPPKEYRTTAEAWTLQRHVMQHLESIPGVTDVATTSNLPVQRGLNNPVSVPGCGTLTVQDRAISSNYFRVMGIPLLAGREFLDTDQANAVIINSALARRCWPGRNPLGMTVAGSQVVGVVGNTKEGALDNPALSVVYVPQWTVSDRFTQMVHGWFLTAWVIRAKTPLAPKTVHQALDAVDPTLPIASFEPMTESIAASFAVSKSRLLAALLDGFTGLALLLAVIGIYGILTYLVTQRTHEIGIRMALGAQKSDVLRMVLGEGLRLTFVGLAAGVIGALGLTRLLSSLLYGVKPSDPVTFIAVSFILVGVAMLACFIPARRATRIDPMEALRYE
ncbi:MAG: ABC transporter permease [Acidobacteriota bacterium]|nr:ABC transporter permease [Acidobacteriota bacterium]